MKPTAAFLAIFIQMSALAQRHQAINLSQGFPDFDGPDYLKSRLAWHVISQGDGWRPDAEALFAAISALVRPKDEVICFDPTMTATGRRRHAPHRAATAGVSR